MFKIVFVALAFVFYGCYLNGGIEVALLGTTFICLVLALAAVIENIFYQKEMDKKIKHKV